MKKHLRYYIFESEFGDIAVIGSSFFESSNGIKNIIKTRTNGYIFNRLKESIRTKGDGLCVNTLNG
jgi:hypothetical protein